MADATDGYKFILLRTFALSLAVSQSARTASTRDKDAIVCLSGLGRSGLRCRDCAHSALHHAAQSSGRPDLFGVPKTGKPPAVRPAPRMAPEST